MSTANTIPRMAGVDGAGCGFEVGVGSPPIEVVLVSPEVKVGVVPGTVGEDRTTWL